MSPGSNYSFYQLFIRAGQYIHILLFVLLFYWLYIILEYGHQDIVICDVFFCFLSCITFNFSYQRVTSTLLILIKQELSKYNMVTVLILRYLVKNNITHLSIVKLLNILISVLIPNLHIGQALNITLSHFAKLYCIDHYEHFNMYNIISILYWHRKLNQLLPGR